MPNVMQKHAIEMATQALDLKLKNGGMRKPDFQDVAKTLRDKFESQYDGYWNCMVKKDGDLGYSIWGEGNRSICFTIGSYKFTIFQSPNSS